MPRRHPEIATVAPGEVGLARGVFNPHLCRALGYLLLPTVRFIPSNSHAGLVSTHDYVFDEWGTVPPYLRYLTRTLDKNFPPQFTTGKLLRTRWMANRTEGQIHQDGADGYRFIVGLQGSGRLNIYEGAMPPAVRELEFGPGDVVAMNNSLPIEERLNHSGESDDRQRLLLVYEKQSSQIGTPT